MKAIFIQGFAGTGKSILAQFLSDAEGATILDRDLMVKGEDDRSLAYRLLKERLQELIAADKDVIIDAPFLFELKNDSFKDWLGLFSDEDEVIVFWLDGASQSLFKRRILRDLPRDQDPNLLLKIESEKKIYRPGSAICFYTDRIQEGVLRESALYLAGIKGRKIDTKRIEPGGSDALDSLNQLGLQDLPLLLNKNIEQIDFKNGLTVFTAKDNGKTTGVVIFSDFGQLVWAAGAPAAALLPFALLVIKEAGIRYLTAHDPTPGGVRLLKDFIFVDSGHGFWRRHL